MLKVGFLDVDWKEQAPIEKVNEELVRVYDENEGCPCITAAETMGDFSTWVFTSRQVTEGEAQVLYDAEQARIFMDNDGE